MLDILLLPADYAAWLAELKTRIHAAQQRAALAVNRELVLLYWQIGRDILDRQDREGWGAKVIERLAQDLRNAFPDMKGFSPRNLKYMRAFAEARPDAEFVQGVLAQLRSRHLVTSLRRGFGAGGEPGIEGGEVAPRLPLAKIGFSLEGGHFFRDGHDEELVHGNMLLLGHLAGVGEERIGNSQCVIGHQVFSSFSCRRNAPGVMTGMRKSAAAAKSPTFSVTSPSARPFSAVSNTISSAGSRSCGRHR